MDERLMKITVTRGKETVHEDVIPWSEVAAAQKAWTMPLGLNRSLFRFRSEPLQEGEAGDFLAASLTAGAGA